MKRPTVVILLSIVVGVVLWAVLALINVKATPSVSTALPNGLQAVDWVKEGPCQAPQLMAGPFDLHRRYRSMEGPYVSAGFRIGDLIAARSAELPEQRVRFVENNNAPEVKSSNEGGMMAISGNVETPVGLVDTKGKPQQLYWLKGFKMEVLDENGKVMPTAEFICHLNLDVDAGERNKAFPHGEKTTYTRLLTITQGQTEVHFPEGYAFPVSSDETWRVAFQAANRTTDQHRRVKHRATFYFVKDSDLTYPVTAMYMRTPFVGVVVDRPYQQALAEDRKAHPTCDVMVRGVNAPNATMGGVFTDNKKRVISGHFVVPPGRHEYVSVVNDQDPGIGARDRTMRYGWVHIHPCCEKAYVRECTGDAKHEMVTSHIQTDLHEGKGVEIKHIDALEQPGGVVLKRGGHYEIGAVYNNNTGSALDSMVTIGMFFDDVDFKRPDWALPGYKEDKPFCGITECKLPKKDGAAVAGTSATPSVFDPTKDGPLLKRPVTVEIKTSDGPLKAVLDPAYAPISVTQVYKLMVAGVYNDTPFVRYDPNFVMQIALADQKEAGKKLDPSLAKLIRTLPLEDEAQKAKRVKHTKYALSMARQDDDVNSASTSFSILLNEAPHLDGKYTIIGFLANDAKTLATLDKMEKTFDKQHPVILSCSK